MILSEAWAVVYKKKKASGTSKSTLRGYNTAFNAFIAYAGDIDITKINTEVAQDFLNQLDMKPKSKQTRRKQITTIFNYFIKLEWLVRNPMKFTDTIKVSKQSRKGLTVSEYNAMFEATEGDPAKTLFLSWIFSGIRMPSEYMALDISKIDLPNRTMHVIRVKTRTEGPVEILDHLHDALTYAVEHDMNLKPYCTTTAVASTFKLLAHIADIPMEKHIPYIGRHTVATKMAAEFNNTFRLMKLMGWTSIAQAETYINMNALSDWGRIADAKRVAAALVQKNADEAEFMRKMVNMMRMDNINN